ncbi:chorismate-binding protein [Thermogymnomonas acidicola]|uniref:chorismate-binding protein n=1 Tax=Thermogymnomonas acidicola TaxID=399579 RepID=UPI0009468301|nr:chorismate-binding protein [Thermogymnomonas acidicola]
MRVTSSMEVHRYASVQHLVSTVVGRMREGIGNLDVLRAVFPAGTVSGAPKERAMELIDLYEAYPRGGAYSGGAIGTVSRDRMDLALLIRTIFRDETGTYVQAGAGIVKDSRPEREMEEMSEKIGTIMGGVS